MHLTIVLLFNPEGDFDWNPQGFPGVFSADDVIECVKMYDIDLCLTDEFRIQEEIWPFLSKFAPIQFETKYSDTLLLIPSDEPYKEII